MTGVDGKNHYDFIPTFMYDNDMSVYTFIILLTTIILVSIHVIIIFISSQSYGPSIAIALVTTSFMIH